MSALLAGYGSSDDEEVASGPSRTRLPTFNAAPNAQTNADDDDEDDVEAERQANEDAFGLNVTAEAGSTNGSGAGARAGPIAQIVQDIVAAPDVLAEVRLG